MKLHWRIFTNCTSADSALKVAASHFEKAGISAAAIKAEPYHKGGFQVSAHTEHTAQPWSEFVVYALATAQNTGHGWQLTGTITEELDAWSNSSVISGITSTHVQAVK
jgi:hypothetical protein